MTRRLISLLLAAALALPLTGCWDHLEVSEMLIIAGIGLDAIPGEEGYYATVEIINVSNSLGENIAAAIVEGEGPTIHSALENAMSMTGGTMFGNHCKVIVLGEELAERGIHPVLETILRSPAYRKTVHLLVARGSTANEILAGRTVHSGILSYELAKIADSNADSSHNTVTAGMYRLHEQLLSDCPFAVVPAVYTRQNNDEAVLQVDGCAVFAGDSLAGFLDGERLDLYHLLTRSGRDVTVRVEDALASGRSLDARLAGTVLNLTPGFSDGRPTLRIDLAADVTLANSVLDSLDPTDPTELTKLRERLNHALATQLMDFIRLAQDTHGADIFGFYRVFQDAYRDEWPALNENWTALFRSLSVTIHTDLRITGSGLAADYAPSPGQGGNALP